MRSDVVSGEYVLYPWGAGAALALGFATAAFGPTGLRLFAVVAGFTISAVLALRWASLRASFRLNPPDQVAARKNKPVRSHQITILEDDPDGEATFMAALLATLGLAIWADGDQDARETTAAVCIALKFLEGALSVEELTAFFASPNLKMPDTEFLTEEARLVIMHAALEVVAADGVLHPGEKELLDRLAELLAIPSDILDDLFRMLEGLGSGMAETDSESPLGLAFRILGLEPRSSVIDAKRAYRRLALQFHPDRNSATRDMAAIANECMIWLTWAYNSILHGAVAQPLPSEAPPEILLRGKPHAP